MKCVIVTGGSRGIGSAICQKLAADTEYHILINYHSNKEAAEQTLEAVKKNGATGEIIQFNVSDFEEVKNALTHWQEANPEAIVEAIVNNAGITKDGLFMWMSPEDWSSVVNTSLNGFFNVTPFVKLYETARGVSWGKQFQQVFIAPTAQQQRNTP